MLTVYYAGPLVVALFLVLVLFKGSDSIAEVCGGNAINCPSMGDIPIAEQEQEQDLIIPTLTARDSSFMDAVRTKDIDGIASMYDGSHPLDPPILYRPAPGKVITGQTNIKTEWGNLFEELPTVVISETIESIGGNEALGQGFTTGSTTMTENGFEVLGVLLLSLSFFLCIALLIFFVFFRIYNV